MFRFPLRAHALSGRSLHWEPLLVYGLFHVPMTVLFGVILLKSMSWETIIDTPMFMYSGFLMDRFGMVPVRDFFTYNMPGTHVIFRWLYHFFGGSILGMRLADTAVLAVILALFVRILKPFGLRVAWGGAVIFGILHVTLGLHCYLERDYIALVPLALAILSAAAWFRTRSRLRWFMTGLFVGSLITIKPHLTICAPALFVFLVVDGTESGAASKRAWLVRALHVARWCALGGCLPIVWMAAYLAYYGVLGEFLNTIVVYFPLHADISGSHVVFEPGEKLSYRIIHFFESQAWDYFQMAIAACAGIALFLGAPDCVREQKRYGILLIALGLIYLVYPCIAARFYDHHYYPFRLLSTVWVAFCLRKWSAETPFRVKACAWTIMAYVIGGAFYVNYEILQHSPVARAHPPSRITSYYRTERLRNWLGQRLEPSDTVQSIEWAFCGITHALMETQTKPATHTIWGEVFFHHVSHPFIQELKKDFIDQLAGSKPRFIIRSKLDWDYVMGRDCSTKFPELDAILEERYFLALESTSFRVWELNESPTAAADRERFGKSPEELATIDTGLSGEHVGP